MNRIIHRQQLAENVIRLTVEAPLIAEERSAGQFIILQVESEFGERIPLTIADADPVAGTITLIVQVVGATTRRLAALRAGENIPELVGPLGCPTHIENYGTAVCVGGGIGAAPLYPIVQALKEAGNRVLVILGARTRDSLIMEAEMRIVADDVIICTDDGSKGRRGLVTEPLKELCQADVPDIVFAIGPPVMMKFCARTTEPFHVRTIASLNTIMVDGTGMCGGCRVNVGGEVKFVCVDGPEFDAHQVDFDNMIHRLDSYKSQEYEKDHHCRAEIPSGPR